jgi:VWFA-related protein
MFPARVAALALLAVAVCLAGPRALSHQRPTAIDFLDRYAAGHFDAALDDLQRTSDADAILKQLREFGTSWIALNGSVTDARELARRRLAAATFALEVARLDQWREWKRIQTPPVMEATLSATTQRAPQGEKEAFQPLNTLWWAPSPLLVEWGCIVLRANEKPDPAERWWHLAALAVAQRAEDPQFLIGDTKLGLGSKAGEIMNEQHEILHLKHSQDRFPNEARFVLAEGIARFRDWADDAHATYRKLADRPDVGGEALAREGQMFITEGKLRDAIDRFDEAERRTRDPYVLYLAAYLRGTVLMRQREPARAEASFRRALAEAPGAQSASTALAALVLARNGYEEATTLAAGMVGSEPPPFDPWRGFLHADDRFWPLLISRLRGAIAPQASQTGSATAQRRAAGAATSAAQDVVAPPTRGQQPPPQQTPAFRTATDVVFVDVSVRRRGAAVTGLTAADFDVRDNGVRQKVESVESMAVPIDLTLIIDVSGGQRTTFSNRDVGAAVVRRVNEQIARVAASLRPIDRMRVITVDTYVHELVRPALASDIGRIDLLHHGGHSSVYDAIVGALLQPVDPDRRHVIIAGVKNRDDQSAVEAAAVREVASRSGSLLHVVLEEMLTIEDEAREDTRCIEAGLCQSPFRSLQRTRRMQTASLQLTPDGVAIKEAAEATGGKWHQAVLFSEPSIRSTFEQVFQEFGERYVLRYRPEGVARAGWHSITVAVPGTRDATVLARKGYAIEATADPSAASPLTIPAALAREGTPDREPASVRTVADLARAWERGGLPALDAIFRTPGVAPVRFLTELERSGNLWPGYSRREALFILELADAILRRNRSETFKPIADLLDRVTGYVAAPIEPDEFEQAWHWAATSLAQGRFWQIPAVPRAVQARVRFPGDPRFVLAEAIAIDQRWRTFGPVVGVRLTGQSVSEAHVAEVTQKYRDAMEFAETRDEAAVRLAWLQHRIGRHDEALATLDSVAASVSDRDIAYVRHLFRGHVLMAAGRVDDAAVAYRAGASSRPGAQSARVGLMNALMVRGDVGAAAQLADTIETAPGVLDPWWEYWSGNFRWFARALDALREPNR